MKKGTAILVSARAAHRQPAMVFPSMKGADLTSRSLSLPGDFPAPFSLVFVAFEIRQQADADSWRPFVDKAHKRRPTLGVFELPTIPRTAKRGPRPSLSTRTWLRSDGRDPRARVLVEAARACERLTPPEGVGIIDAFRR